ncbi:zinc knuckle (CCHC-type) family protein [Striga asiatica]|uniref:Zinc knuckle (CCHC-type) family protein n=1 Tax=Striga asiatica TaxID=4170 RepID=A0A5A7PDG7_STRAF|nr:zinc knuckle (CCHC-type) family protein [Striga asiatica]
MDEEGGASRLGKKPSDNGGEVDYKTKSGTAWSHSFLNQKPWHPLSYPNQRRKWIAEQTHAQRQRRAEEVAREYAQEQEFLRQTALISKKEKEKIHSLGYGNAHSCVNLTGFSFACDAQLELMKAVSFMYVKPPGYNAESAKAAEIADEKRKQESERIVQEPSLEGTSSSMKTETTPSVVEKKKPRPKDIYGRPLPTEEEFEVLKNAPRLETGVAGRAKPFGVEIRNVKCLRCGNFGHQSGDRECPLKDAIMPNEENRLKRDDPLTAILAQTDPTEVFI